MKKKKFYVTYGTPNKGKKVIRFDSYLNKIQGSFWGCRVFKKGMHYSWFNWVNSEGFHVEKYKPSTRRIYTLKKDAKILYLHDYDGIKFLLDNAEKFLFKLPKSFYLEDYFNLELNLPYIYENYDGIELIHGKAYNDLRLTNFNAWDVDSIQVWNSEILEEVTNPPSWVMENVLDNEKGNYEW